MKAEAPNPRRSPSVRLGASILFWGVTSVVVVVVGLRALRARDPIPGDAALIPAAFAEGLTYEQGQARSREEARPMLVVASASWCAPCQAYKRDALADERVTRAIREGFVPVYLDISADRETAERLGIGSIPSTIVVKDGEIVRRREGRLSTAQLLSVLER